MYQRFIYEQHLAHLFSINLNCKENLPNMVQPIIIFATFVLKNKTYSVWKQLFRLLYSRFCSFYPAYHCIVHVQWVKQTVQ